MPGSHTVDCLVVGGGAVGLSIAYTLARSGVAAVRVIDTGAIGQEASWAGAGILPPASETAASPLDRLAAFSNQCHEKLSKWLLAETGIDNGLRRCGGIYLARSERHDAELRETAAQWKATGIAAEPIDPQDLARLEPNLQPREPVRSAWHVPGEMQLRNPRHLKALSAARLARGVTLSSHTPAEDFEISAGRVVAVRTPTERIAAGTVCLAGGAWTGKLAAKLGLTLSIHPIRGQIVLLAAEAPPLARIVNEGPRYLVPRDDGRVLVGSTEEHVGFDRGTTPDAIAELLQFAHSLVPSLAAAPVETSWSGFRPATADGLPYIGPVPGLENLFVAAGHFRSGLQLSPATAVVVAQQLIRGKPLGFDLSPFRIDRGWRATRDISKIATRNAALSTS